MIIVVILVAVDPDQALVDLASLADDVRRALYRYVRCQGHPVTRDEAAAAAGISRKLAAFHLDKLVDRGLLEASSNLPGEGRRRVGRAPKTYVPSAVEIAVSIPERRYEVMGQILTDALGSGTLGELALQAARRAAGARGAEVGTSARGARHLRRPGPERTVSVAKDLLVESGFEPRPDGQGGLVLRNCPFQALARQAPTLVCDLNQAFIDGLLRGLGNDSVVAGLEPEPGRCCVRLRPPAPGPPR